MMSKHIPSAGAAVAVQDSEGPGSPIVFVHGNSCSHRCFGRQLGSRALAAHRLVAIDLPGHGDSQPARDPAATYRLPGYADAVVEVVRQLALPPSVFVGWSLGGHVVLEASARLADHAGFLVFGAPPIRTMADMPRAFLPAPASAVAFREDSSDEEIAALLACFVRPGAPVPAFAREDFRRTDKRARSCIAASIERGDFADEVDIVRTLARPLAVLHGAHEQLVQRRYLDELAMPTLWRGAVQDIADAGHAPQWDSPDTFERLVAAFAADCARPR